MASEVVMGSEDVLIEIHPHELRFGGIFHSTLNQHHLLCLHGEQLL